MLGLVSLWGNVLWLFSGGNEFQRAVTGNPPERFNLRARRLHHICFRGCDLE